VTVVADNTLKKYLTELSEKKVPRGHPNVDEVSTWLTQEAAANRLATSSHRTTFQKAAM
jgi:hypothetical protein